MTTSAVFSLLGVALFGLGLFRTITAAGGLERVVAVNVMATGIGSVLIAGAWRGPDAPADPVPHAMVLTGVVVTVSATALALALLRRLHDETADDGD